MSSGIQEIEEFELSLTSNAFEGTVETADSIPSTKKSRKTSPVHEHCRTPTPRRKTGEARIEMDLV
jgi:hypothetical protein